MDRIVYFTMSFQSVTIPSVGSAWTSLRNVLQTFHRVADWLPIALTGLLLLRYRRSVNWMALLAIVLAAFAWLAGMSMYNVEDRRHYFAVGAIVALMYATSLTGLLFALQETFAGLKKPFAPPPLRRLVLSCAFLVLLAIHLAPTYRKSDALAHYYTLHDRRNDLMRYMDISLEPGKFVTNRVETRTISDRSWSQYLGLIWGNHKTFNRAWGGYDGAHDFPLAQTIFELESKPLNVWRANNAVYAIMPYPADTDDPRVYFPDETVLLKSYPPDSNFSGPSMVVLRLHPMQNDHAGQLGAIRLLGYDISATTAQAGDDIVFRHYWAAESAPASALHVFNHLLNDQGEIAAQVDGIPLFDSRRDSSSWDDPDEILLGRNFILRLPADLPPGAYSLVSGFYDPQTGARLPNMERRSGDFLQLTAIEVIASSQPAQ